MPDLRALSRERALKLRITILLVGGFGAAYFLVGYFPLRPVVQLEATWVETAIGFRPGWIWVYVSLYLFMPIGPLLLSERGQLIRYAWGMSGIAAAACLVFIVIPTATARPAEAPDAPGLYRLIVTLDPVTNSVPSLHCAFAAYSVGVARIATPRRWRFGLWLWFTLICFSTLATRQHMLLDVVTGVALGGVAYLMVWRRLAAPATSTLPGCLTLDEPIGDSHESRKSVSHPGPDPRCSRALCSGR